MCAFGLVFLENWQNTILSRKKGALKSFTEANKLTKKANPNSLCTAYFWKFILIKKVSWTKV